MKGDTPHASVPACSAALAFAGLPVLGADVPGGVSVLRLEEGMRADVAVAAAVQALLPAVPSAGAPCAADRRAAAHAAPRTAPAPGMAMRHHLSAQRIQ